MSKCKQIINEEAQAVRERLDGMTESDHLVHALRGTDPKEMALDEAERRAGQRFHDLVREQDKARKKGARKTQENAADRRTDQETFFGTLFDQYCERLSHLSKEDIYRQISHDVGTDDSLPVHYKLTASRIKKHILAFQKKK